MVKQDVRYHDGAPFLDGERRLFYWIDSRWNYPLIRGTPPARKVSDLVVAHIHDQTVESIKWKEPPIFKWEDRNRLKIARAQDGEHKELIRRLTYPINDILSSSLSVSGEFHNG